MTEQDLEDHREYERFKRLAGLTKSDPERHRTYYHNNRNEIAKRRSKRYQSRKNDPEFILQSKNQVLKTRYGLTLEEFLLMKLKCAGLCQICKTEPEHLCIDHDHSSKKVRGLLCNTCNISLGGFKDDIGLLTNAINYLKA